MFGDGQIDDFVCFEERLEDGPVLEEIAA